MEGLGKRQPSPPIEFAAIEVKLELCSITFSIMEGKLEPNCVGFTAPIGFCIIEGKPKPEILELIPIEFAIILDNVELVF